MRGGEGLPHGGAERQARGLGRGRSGLLEGSGPGSGQRQLLRLPDAREAARLCGAFRAGQALSRQRSARAGAHRARPDDHPRPGELLRPERARTGAPEARNHPGHAQRDRGGEEGRPQEVARPAAAVPLVEPDDQHQVQGSAGPEDLRVDLEDRGDQFPVRRQTRPEQETVDRPLGPHVRAGDGHHDVAVQTLLQGDRREHAHDRRRQPAEASRVRGQGHSHLLPVQRGHEAGQHASALASQRPPDRRERAAQLDHDPRQPGRRGGRGEDHRQQRQGEGRAHHRRRASRGEPRPEPDRLTSKALTPPSSAGTRSSRSTTSRRSSSRRTGRSDRSRGP